MLCSFSSSSAFNFASDNFMGNSSNSILNSTQLSHALNIPLLESPVQSENVAFIQSSCLLDDTESHRKLNSKLGIDYTEKAPNCCVVMRLLVLSPGLRQSKFNAISAHF